MSDVITGFLVIGVAVLVGYIAGRAGVLGEHGRYVLARLLFFVLSPFLLFYVLAHARLDVLFSSLLPVSALAALVMFAAHAVVARFAWHRSAGQVMVGSMTAGFVNSNNIGIPIAAYVLGNASLSAPIILVQLIVFTPMVLGMLDSITRGEKSFVKTVRAMIVNPMILGSLAGVLVAISQIELPEMFWAPIELVSNATIPIMLISFGMSLSGARVLSTLGTRRDIVLATALKLIAMPLTAWAIGRFLFGLDDHQLQVVTVLAALPTAQNIFNYAQRYDVGETVARDVVFLTTVGCVPVIVVSTLLLSS